MRCRVVSAVLFLLVGGVLCRAADVKPQPIDPSTALFPSPRECKEFTQESRGRLSSQALITSFEGFGTTVHAAVDQYRSRVYNVVALDLSGDGEFAKPLVVTMKPHYQTSTRYYGTYGPAVLQVERGGTKIPFGIIGDYHHYPISGGIQRRLRIRIGVMLKGRCMFGSRSEDVVLIDGNQNLVFGDKSSESGKEVNVGDTIIVGNIRSSRTHKFLYGQPLYVNNKWYELTLEKNPLKFTAKPVEVATGEIVIKHRDWSAFLVGDDGSMFGVSGSVRPIPIPVGGYSIAKYVEHAQGAEVVCEGKKRAHITVTEGKTQDVAIGSPLMGKPIVKQSGRELSFSFELLEASGLPVDTIVMRGGGRPPPPKIAVYDKEKLDKGYPPAKAKLHEANLHYG